MCGFCVLRKARSVYPALEGLGFRVQGSGFRVWSLGFGASRFRN